MKGGRVRPRTRRRQPCRQPRQRKVHNCEPVKLDGSFRHYPLQFRGRTRLDRSTARQPEPLRLVTTQLLFEKLSMFVAGLSEFFRDGSLQRFGTPVPHSVFESARAHAHKLLRMPQITYTGHSVFCRAVYSWRSNLRSRKHCAAIRPTTARGRDHPVV